MNCLITRPILQAAFVFQSIAGASAGTKRTFLGGLGALGVRLMSSSEGNEYKFDTLNVTTVHDFVKHVEINRPEKRNALSLLFVRELDQCFSQLAIDPDCRLVILSAAGKVFSSGIDLSDPETMNILNSDKEVGRRAAQLHSEIPKMQNSFSTLEKSPKPVIVAIQSACLGLAIDLICPCDVRVCTQDAWFQIKEADLGLAADIGTLQRFPKLVNNDSLARELVYTTRKFDAEEAKSLGFVSHVFTDKDQMMEACMKLGQSLATKSPVAVQGSKVNMNYSRDRAVKDGLKYMVSFQQAMLQSEDFSKALQAARAKETATFSKL